MTAFDVAAEEAVSPWDALLLAVRRRAARVRSVDRVLDAAWIEHRRLCEADPTYGNPDVPGDEVRKWLVESRNEERLLTRSAKMAIDAGVADALVRRLEVEGRLAVDALLAGLDVLDLTTEQRMKALSTMHGALAQLPPGATASTIEGIVTSDPEEDA
jgi:hypothetical protein